MSYQDRIDIDRLYDLIYDARSEQLKVVTKEEFEQLFGSISSFKDMQELYYDKSEVYLKILDVLKEAGVITDEQYNELVSRIESVSTVANRADGKADDLRTDVGTVTGSNLQSQINTVDGKADGLRDDVGTVTGDDLQTQVTTASGTASSAYNLADGADTKADNLRIDVGTVNQPTDGSLQQQITYLPSYISKLQVESDGSGTLTANKAHFDLNDTAYIKVAPSELGYKIMRDGGTIQYTITVTEPDGTVTTYHHYLVQNVNVIRAISLNQKGIYVIACENLKCVILVGEYADAIHTHSISDVTNLQSSLTNLENLIDGKADSEHYHSISDITDYEDLVWETPSTYYITKGNFKVCEKLGLAHWWGNGGQFYPSTSSRQQMDDVSPYKPKSKIIRILDDTPNQMVTMTIKNDGTVWVRGTSNTTLTTDWDIMWRY